MEQLNIKIREQTKQFTTENRMIQCVEEMSELTKQLCKYSRMKMDDKTCIADKHSVMCKIVEEMADTECCFEQLKEMLNITQEKIEKVKQIKYERTERRLRK